jgi:hypothetical protein
MKAGETAGEAEFFRFIDIVAKTEPDFVVTHSKWNGLSGNDA